MHQFYNLHVTYLLFESGVLSSHSQWLKQTELSGYVLLYPFNGFFSRTSWVKSHQKGKPFWISTKQEMMGGSGISWTICKSFAPHSRQTCQYRNLSTQFLQARCPYCS